LPLLFYSTHDRSSSDWDLCDVQQSSGGCKKLGALRLGVWFQARREGLKS